jgi:hypothetical protein
MERLREAFRRKGHGGSRRPRALAKDSLDGEGHSRTRLHAPPNRIARYQHTSNGKDIQEVGSCISPP